MRPVSAKAIIGNAFASTGRILFLILTSDCGFLWFIQNLELFNYEPISSGGLRPPQHQVEYKSSLLIIEFVSLIAEGVSKV